MTMSKEPLAQFDSLSDRANEQDYDAALAAATVTERGRWFLAEYARRNRHAETEPVVAALARVEAAIRGEAAALPAADSNRELFEIAAAIERISVAADAGATATRGAALERLQDIAFVLHERPVEPSLCDALDGAVREIAEAFGSAETAGASLRELAERLRVVIASAAPRDAAESNAEIGATIVSVVAVAVDESEPEPESAFGSASESTPESAAAEPGSAFGSAPESTPESAPEGPSVLLGAAEFVIAVPEPGAESPPAAPAAEPPEPLDRLPSGSDAGVMEQGEAVTDPSYGLEAPSFTAEPTPHGSREAREVPGAELPAQQPSDLETEDEAPARPLLDRGAAAAHPAAAQQFLPELDLQLGPSEKPADKPEPAPDAVAGAFVDLLGSQSGSDSTSLGAAPVGYGTHRVEPPAGVPMPELGAARPMVDRPPPLADAPKTEAERPAKDPLAAVNALSAEELIALFS